MPPSKSKPSAQAKISKGAVIGALKAVLDPELGIDVYTLGFVRRIDLDAEKRELKLDMTLTSPLCPYGPRMMKDVESRLLSLGLKKVSVEMVFDPPWEPDPEVRKILGI